MYASYNDSLTVRSDIVCPMFTDEYWNYCPDCLQGPQSLVPKMCTAVDDRFPVAIWVLFHRFYVQNPSSQVLNIFQLQRAENCLKPLKSAALEQSTIVKIIGHGDLKSLDHYDKGDEIEQRKLLHTISIFTSSIPSPRILWPN